MQSPIIADWKNRLINLLMILAAAFVLLIPAIWNGFPHVYSDTGAYLATAFEGTIPLGRPTGYGLFIRYTALGNQLWLTVFVQALLFSLLLWRSLKIALPNANSRLVFPVAIVVAAIGSGANWYVGQLMPDVFTGMLVLVFYLLVFDAETNWFGRALLAFLAYVFCFSHYSHMALLIALSFGLFAWSIFLLLRKRKTVFPWSRFIWTLTPALLAVLSFYIVNYTNDLGWRMTRSSHVFTMAKLSESGMLKAYLNETCEEKYWRLCPYADSLPSSAAAFIWNNDSPFKKTGYWDQSRPEYDSLISDFFARPKFLFWYAKDGARSTIEQLFELSVGEGLTPYNENSSPYKFFERAMPSKIPAYLGSVQFDRELSFDTERKVLKALMVISFLTLLIPLFWRKNQFNKAMLYLSGVSVAGYVLNAAITGALANVYSRLQARIAWLIPFIAILILWEFWTQFRKKTN